MIAKPAMTGKHEPSNMGILMLSIREHKYPASGIPTPQITPKGNCNKMLSIGEKPKVDTIRGPNPETAPFTVYLMVYRQHSVLVIEKS